MSENNGAGCPDGELHDEQEMRLHYHLVNLLVIRREHPSRE